MKQNLIFFLKLFMASGVVFKPEVLILYMGDGAAGFEPELLSFG
jgi:hypothetical protein